MLVAGLDYSMTSPAICIHDTEKEFQFDSSLVYFMTQTKKYEVKFRNVEGVFFDYTSEAQRYDTISSYFLDRILEHEVQSVYIEDYSYGSKGKVFHIAENTGVMKYRLWNYQIDYTPVPPTVIKKFATGKGNSDKQKMQDAFIAEAHRDLKFELKMTEKQWNPSSDIIDAYWICKYAHESTIKLNAEVENNNE